MLQLISGSEVFRRSALVDHNISRIQHLWYEQFDGEEDPGGIVRKKEEI